MPDGVEGAVLAPRYKEIERRETATAVPNDHCTYDRVRDGKADPPFVDAAHSFVVFSLSQQKIPPMCTDVFQPAVLVHGTFASEETAREFAAALHEAAPVMHVFVDVTHKWIVATRDTTRMRDSGVVDAVLQDLIAQKQLRDRLDAEEFHANVKNSKAGSACIKTERKTRVNDGGQSSHRTSASVPAAVRHPSHSRAVVSFLVDYNQAEFPEFAFCVLRTTEDDTEAERFIKNVAVVNVDDTDFHVVNLSEWLFPQLLVTESLEQECFPNPELDAVMKHRRTCTAEAQAFDAAQKREDAAKARRGEVLPVADGDS